MYADHENLFTDEQREEIKTLMNEALYEFFSSKGTLAKNILYTVAGIVGALVVIGGGLKLVLTFLGFTYISK